MHACARVSTCLAAWLSVGVCLHHVLCWEPQAHVQEPVCAPALCTHIHVSPQGPLLGNSHQGVDEQPGSEACDLSLTYRVTSGKLVIVSLPLAAVTCPMLCGCWPLEMRALAGVGDWSEVRALGTHRMDTAAWDGCQWLHAGARPAVSTWACVAGEHGCGRRSRDMTSV